MDGVMHSHSVLLILITNKRPHDDQLMFHDVLTTVITENSLSAVLDSRSVWGTLSTAHSPSAFHSETART